MTHLDPQPDVPSYAEFRRAVAGLIENSCCGAGAHVGALAGPEASDTPFKRLGYTEWAKTVWPRKPKVATTSGRYVLPDVTLVPPAGPRLPHQDVEIADGRVAEIRPAGAPMPQAIATLEACRGAFVSPAFVDMHVHMPPDNVLKLTDLFLLQTLRHGITIVRDAGDPDGTSTPAALEAVLSGHLPGPQMFYAFAFVNRPPARWPNCFTYEDPEQAPAIAARLKHVGASWVKSYEHLDAAQIDAMKRAATEHGIGMMGHVPVALAFEDALIPDSQHLFGIPEPRYLRRPHIVNRMIDWAEVDEARFDVIRRATEAKGLAHTPSLGVSENVLRLARYDETADAPGARALPSFYRDIVWNPQHGLPYYRNIAAEDFDRLRAAIEKKQRLVRLLHEDGVDLRVGSDTQQPFVAPGVALHDDIAAFEAAGIARGAAFEKATRGATRALGLADAGEVVVGNRAELLVARRDPTESGWSVARDVVAVVARGTLTYADELDRAIEHELGRFEGALAKYVTHFLAHASLKRVARNYVP